MNEASQNTAILNHMKTVGPITSIEAIHEYGCTRLASRISELEKLGFEIEREWKRDPLTGKRWREYRLR